MPYAQILQGIIKAAPAIIGGAQAISGGIKQRKSDGMMPSSVDPKQEAMQRYFARQKTAYETGTANNANRTALRQAMQSGINSSLKLGAGTRGLNAMNQMYLQGILGLNQQGDQMQSANAQVEAQALDNIAQRKLELSLLKYNTQQARAAQLKTTGASNLMGALARSGTGSIGSGKTKSSSGGSASFTTNPSGTTTSGLADFTKTSASMFLGK